MLGLGIKFEPYKQLAHRVDPIMKDTVVHVPVPVPVPGSILAYFHASWAVQRDLYGALTDKVVGRHVT